jgi:transposase
MEERIEFGLRALGGGNFRALCREYGITARTGYKWRERLVRWGTEGLKEKSRRPQCSPGALGEREVCEMVRFKQAHSRWGPRKIRELYLRLYGRAASESSFKRVLERAGLTERRARWIGRRRDQSEKVRRSVPQSSPTTSTCRGTPRFAERRQPSRDRHSPPE